MSDPSTGARLEQFVRARWTRRQGGIRKLAELAGLDKDTLYAWFRGDGEPSLSYLRGLALTLGVERSEIVAAMDGVEAAPTDVAARLDALITRDDLVTYLDGAKGEVLEAIRSTREDAVADLARVIAETTAEALASLPRPRRGGSSPGRKGTAGRAGRASAPS